MDRHAQQEWMTTGLISIHLPSRSHSHARPLKGSCRWEPSLYGPFPPCPHRLQIFCVGSILGWKCEMPCRTLDLTIHRRLKMAKNLTLQGKHERKLLKMSNPCPTIRVETTNISATKQLLFESSPQTIYLTPPKPMSTMYIVFVTHCPNILQHELSLGPHYLTSFT